MRTECAFNVRKKNIIDGDEGGNNKSHREIFCLDQRKETGKTGCTKDEM